MQYCRTWRFIVFYVYGQEVGLAKPALISLKCFEPSSFFDFIASCLQEYLNRQTTVLFYCGAERSGYQSDVLLFSQQP